MSRSNLQSNLGDILKNYPSMTVIVLGYRIKIECACGGAEPHPKAEFKDDDDETDRA